MLARAWGHFDKSELSKFAPRFSTMVIPVKSLITVDFYPHGHKTLKWAVRAYSFEKNLSTSSENLPPKVRN